MKDVDPTNATAIRTWNPKGNRATVTVVMEDGYTRKLGGDRAARCRYVVLYQRAAGDWCVLGLRTEPHGHRVGTARVHVVPITNANDGNVPASLRPGLDLLG